MKKIKLVFFSALFLLGNLTISADDIIEHRGDRYVIHVEALNPDSEMTLLDVLHLCPELISYDGKNITNGYRLRINNTAIAVDQETVLENIKASELKYVQICNYTSAAKGVNGGGGVIDIYYKPQEGTSGKVAIEGSTYGNGKLYADIKSKVSENLILTGYAMTNQQYTKGYPTDGGTLKSRNTSEAAHLLIDWNMSKKDNLKIKLYQQFNDYKNKITDITNSTMVFPMINRYSDMVATYEHTLNDNGALLIFEGGVDYLSTSSEFGAFDSNTNSFRETAPYFFIETNYPVLNNELWIMLGWEIDYDNSWYKGVSREQYMFNNIYLQFDYSHGPWVFTLGDRFRHLNYWNRLADPNDNGLWSHNRNNHGFVASAGYKTKGHFIQAAFDRDHYVPSVESDFFGDKIDGKRTYNTDYKTNLIWRAEARYTYQNENFVFFGNVLHTWMNDLPGPNEQTTGIRTSATWNKGPLRLTAGVNYYHYHVNATPAEGGKHENYYTLKLAPTLLLGKGFRVSSVLLYCSRQKLHDIHPHLYSSVKVNKDFGRHFNVFADFHDLAGMPTMTSLEMINAYNKRALTVGMTYRFGGKK